MFRIIFSTKLYLCYGNIIITYFKKIHITRFKSDKADPKTLDYSHFNYNALLYGKAYIKFGFIFDPIIP